MSELRRDREWEHWPADRRTDEGIRRKLRGLFHPTIGDGDIEYALEAHTHEIELRAQELADTVADLERREARTHELRSAVEQMLRRGSAELDDRHAELSELAARLAERETAVANTEDELASRRQELGAVELRRAAVERREEAIAAQEEELSRRAEELQERETALAELGASDGDIAARELEVSRKASEVALLQERIAETLAVVEREQQALAEREAAMQAQEPPVTTADVTPEYVALVPGSRYRLVERDDGPPAIGGEIHVEAARFRIARIGPSPLPGDGRRCAFLELAPADEP